MALINSIALGQARGKLGNIVFQYYGSRSIARQKNDSISVPPSAAQVANRFKVGNSRGALMLLQSFLVDFNNRDFKGLTLSQGFFKIFKPYCPDHALISGAYSLAGFPATSMGQVHEVAILEIVREPEIGDRTGLKVFFQGLPFDPASTYKMKVGYTKIGEYAVFVQDIDVSIADINAGYKVVEIDNSTYNMAYAYLYESTLKVASNCYFSDYLAL